MNSTLVHVHGTIVTGTSSPCHHVYIQQVGTEDQPFLHRATITLHGTIDDPEIPIYGAKVGCGLYPNANNNNYITFL